MVASPLAPLPIASSAPPCPRVPPSSMIGALPGLSAAAALLPLVVLALLAPVRAALAATLLALLALPRLALGFLRGLVVDVPLL